MNGAPVKAHPYDQCALNPMLNIKLNKIPTKAMTSMADAAPPISLITLQKHTTQAELCSET